MAPDTFGSMTERRSKRNPGEEPSAVLTSQAYERLTEELGRLKAEGRNRMAERLQARPKSWVTSERTPNTTRPRTSKV